MRLLRFAAVFVGLQAVALLAVAGVFVAEVRGDRVPQALGSAGFFAAYAVGLAFCAYGLANRLRWARGPVLLSELLFVCVVWALGRGAIAVAVPVTASAVIVLGCLLHPRTVAGWGD